MSTEIMIPNFVSNPNADFINTVKNELIDFYVTGSNNYFRNQVIIHHPDTRVYFKFDVIFKSMLATCKTKKEQQDMISDITVKLIVNMPYIKKELNTVLPSLLKKMNWEYVKLEFSNFDASKFIGMDHSDESNPVPKYGESACMIIVYMKTMPGFEPIHKPVIKIKSEDVKLPTVSGKYLDAARKVAKMSESKKEDTEIKNMIQNATENVNETSTNPSTDASADGFTVKSSRFKGKRNPN